MICAGEARHLVLLYEPPEEVVDITKMKAMSP